MTDEIKDEVNDKVKDDLRNLRLWFRDAKDSMESDGVMTLNEDHTIDDTIEFFEWAIDVIDEALFATP